MKEFKFRIWDNQTKKYFKNDASFHCYSHFMIDTEGTIYDAVGELSGRDNDRVLKEYKDVDIEQYIGLKDINGKEIYEGDIVRIKSLVDSKYLLKNGYDIDEVAFSNGKFYVKGFGSVLEFNEMEIEVLGNIHENSDLLVD